MDAQLTWWDALCREARKQQIAPCAALLAEAMSLSGVVVWFDGLPGSRIVLAKVSRS
jgi:hypothetical protein